MLHANSCLETTDIGNKATLVAGITTYNKSTLNKSEPEC